MDYLDREFSGISKCGSLYDDDPLTRSLQEMIMARVDSLASNLYGVLMTRGIHEPSLVALTKALEFLNQELGRSETDFFLS